MKAEKFYSHLMRNGMGEKELFYDNKSRKV